jgi:signal transduction histidine kinase
MQRKESTRLGNSTERALQVNRTMESMLASIRKENNDLRSALARKDALLDTLNSQRDDLIAALCSGLVRKLTAPVHALTRHLARLKTHAPSRGRPLKTESELVAAVHQLASLTKFLETLSKEQCERSRVILFDPGKIVEEAINQMKERLTNGSNRVSPINLQYYLRQVSPVEGDPEELRDVVIELISNAMEAMPEGGDLYISAEENAGYACVYIQDSGSSIPADLLPKIMDPFFTTKDGKDGLGLCMARAVLKRHKGDLELESSEGRGTTITLRMPLYKEESRQGKPGTRKRKNTRIMIMEEDHMIRELLFQVLSSKGYHVDSAEAFSEGVEKLKGKVFDMVIAGTVTGDDQAMIRRIRKAAPRACLALIGDPGNGNLPGGASNGPVDLVIPKPIDMSWVLIRISELLSGRAK